MKLSLPTLADCLDLPPNTIERWILQGRIPVQLLNGECHFNKSILKKWTAAHNLKFTPPQAGRSSSPASDIQERLVGVMKRGGILYDIPGQTTEDVLETVVDRLAWLPEASRAELLSKLIERERLTSTGIGKGVAMPHPRSPLSNADNHSFITTCFLSAPVDFKSVDDQPVFVLFLLLSPTVPQHLHLLSRLSFCIRSNEFIRFLKTVPQTKELLSTIAAFEAELEGTKG